MSNTETTRREKRLSPRAKTSKLLRVRPSDPNDKPFEELPVSTNVSKHGIYFHSHRSDYYKGMRLLITFPFTFAQDPTACEYLAEVVRIEKLTDERVGVAVRLLSTL